MTEFGWEPLAGSYLVVALIGGALLALLALKPSFGRLSSFRQGGLIVLRAAVILLVVVALLRPTWIRTVKTPRTSVLIVLYDVSRSMQLPSGQGEQSRWQAQKAALERVVPKLAGLSSEIELRYYGYDSRLIPQEFKSASFALPEQPTGEQTDLGTTLYEALRAEQGRRLAGVILMGDGAQNASEAQVEIQEAGRKLRDDFAAPLYTVTFGLSGDAAQARDVAIERMDEQFTVFVKNELTIRALLRIRGFAKRDLPVELFLEDATGKRESLGKKMVRAEEEGRQVETLFQYTPQRPGHYRLTMVAESQPGELVTKNNQLSAYLTVLEGGLRVLYLDGEKRFEQKFLRRALNASPDIELDDRIIDRRGRQSWPINLGNDLTGDKYDAFILGDLEAAALGKENLQALADAVGRGKGLLVIGGLRSFGRGKYGGTPLEAVLPIKIDRLEGSDFVSDQAEKQFFLQEPLPLVPVGKHPLTRLASDAENERVWRELPPLPWAYKFAGVKNAPGVRVLLESPSKAPLLVSGEFGSGRVLAFAGASTYLWPMHGHELEHKRFWRQVVLWLVRREDVQRDEVWIKLNQRRFNLAGRMEATFGARNASGDALGGTTFDATLILPDGQREPLKLAQQKGQWHVARQLSVPGSYAIEAQATAEGKPVGTARAEFFVFDRDLELSNPAADPDLMLSLAAWTKQDGGRAVAPELLPALVDEIAERPKEYEVRQTRWRLGGTPADAWAYFLALAALLIGEWWLRKKWGLV
jgi:uncharacterized membrane protein